jgi:hypothetical protein
MKLTAIVLGATALISGGYAVHSTTQDQKKQKDPAAYQQKLDQKKAKEADYQKKLEHLKQTDPAKYAEKMARKQQQEAEYQKKLEHLKQTDPAKYEQKMAYKREQEAKAAQKKSLYKQQDWQQKKQMTEADRAAMEQKMAMKKAQQAEYERALAEKLAKLSPEERAAYEQKMALKKQQGAESTKKKAFDPGQKSVTKLLTQEDVAKAFTSSPRMYEFTMSYHPIKGLENQSQWHIGDTHWWVRLHGTPSEYYDVDKLDKTKTYRVVGVVMEQNYGVIEVWVKQFGAVD